MKRMPAREPRIPVRAASTKAVPTSREDCSGLLRSLNVMAHGKPKVRALARKTGQRIMAASSPRPAGWRARAVKIPVAALIAIMKNLAPTDCTTAATEPGDRVLLASCFGGNDAGATANIFDVPVLKKFPLVETRPQLKGRNGIKEGIEVD
jgi:hypothetical protein